MVFDLATGQVRCLSNTQCSPENMLSNPQYYDEDSPLYLKYSGRKERNIAWVDPARGIFWQEHALAGGEGIVWRACSLSDGKPRADIPEWRTASIAQNGAQEYFDGTLHFFAPTYYKFWGLDRTGQVWEWPLDNGEDGECDQFAVLGGRLFINTSPGMQTKYSIYPLSAEMPVRDAAVFFVLAGRAFLFSREKEPKRALWQNFVLPLRLLKFSKNLYGLRFYPPAADIT